MATASARHGSSHKKANGPSSNEPITQTTGDGGNQQQQQIWNKQEQQLLSYVRDNAPAIVRALSIAGGRLGEQNNWTEMQQCLQIGSTLSTYCGLPQTMATVIGGPPLTRSATAGGGRGS